jgi:hypothetical protein
MRCASYRTLIKHYFPDDILELGNWEICLRATPPFNFPISQSKI